MPTSDLQSLETRGYIVVPGFLSAAQLDDLRRDYRGQVPASSQLARGAAYARHTVSSACQASIAPAIEALARRVREATQIRADLLTDTTLFFDTRTNDPFAWHTDHIPRFVWFDVYNYLNFYIPIIKPDPARSGLCLVQMDRLRARAPALHDGLVGKGAVMWTERDGQAIATDDNTGVTLGAIDGGLSEVAEAPLLDAGDLLLIRGDVPHRTQDTETERVAVSFRMIASSSVVERSHYYGNVPHAKMELMLALAPTFIQILQCFHQRGADRLTLGEIHDHLRAAG